jgi:dipeptidyl aminopeptidase/acylaminoacyl peptidase
MRASIRSLAAAAVLAGLTSLASAQQPASVQAGSSAKRPIDAAAIRGLNSIRTPVLTNDGKWFIYVIGGSEGDASLVVKSTGPDAKETRYGVGGTGGGAPQVSDDSKWLGFYVAPRSPGRGARGGGGGGAANPPPAGRGPGGGRGGDSTVSTPSPAQAGNTFVLLNLATGARKDFPRIRRVLFNSDTPTHLAMQGYPSTAAAAPAPAAAADAGRGGGGRGGAGGGAPAGGGGAAGGPADLLVYNIATGAQTNVGIMDEFAFDPSGDFLTYTMDNSDQIGNAIQYFNLKTNSIGVLENERVMYRGLAWRDSGNVMTITKGRIDSLSRDTSYQFVAFHGFTNGAFARKTVFEPQVGTWFPGMRLSGTTAQFSNDFSYVTFSVREAPQATAAGRGRGGATVAAAGGRGTSVVQAGAPGQGGTNAQPTVQATDESSLILWHYKDARLQPAQIISENADRQPPTFQAIYYMADKKAVRLTNDTSRSVSMSSNAQYAYSTDNRAYQTAAVTTGRNYADVYQVDMKTGERKLLFKKVPSASSNFRFSPDGKRAIYWETDGHWWLLDMVTGTKKNVTKGVPTNFANYEDDHNNIFPVAGQMLGWSTDGSSIVLSDRWDLWKVPVDGPVTSAVNLTGNGKKDQIRYQSLLNFGTGGGGGGAGGRGGRGGGGAAGIDLTKPLYIETYGEWTKAEGVAKVEPAKAGAVQLFSDTARITFQKARDGDVFLLNRQRFNEFPDYWTVGADWKNPRRLTDANPQIKELAWSSGTKLIDYKSDTKPAARLQGAMYLPANFDPTKKYPMLVTIYEKRSQNLNGFVVPSETRTPDPTLYTSRGYIVFDPDIVYTINDPGMSAVWCVIPAVKAAIKTGFVDSTKVGLWGHSWGGYQTAHLVTQTNIFKAAVAGAALTNMISMYGSVYWNSGGTDAAIFESSQGRFKGSPLQHMDAYVRNSPVYFADKMNTPLMLLHNDKDGAVDFNQGVTFYNTLVNQGKPVIMLEYMGENHGVSRPVNQRDYAVRMREWFDHYLMGAPAPDWLTNGVPRIKMQEHLQERRDSTGTTGGGRGGRGGLR